MRAGGVPCLAVGGWGDWGVLRLADLLLGCAGEASPPRADDAVDVHEEEH